MDSTDEDALVSLHLAAAVAEVEKDTERAIVWQRYTLTLDSFPQRAIDLEIAPARKLESLRYVDTAGTTQTLATTEYAVDLQREPARLVPAYGLTWPTTRAQENDITITFTAGELVSFTADAATDLITTVGYTPTNGDEFRLSNTGGALPAGLTTGTTYYVVSASGQTCSLSLTSGGGAVNITGAGTGTHFLGEMNPILRQAILIKTAMSFIEREGASAQLYMDGYQRLVTGVRWR